MAGTATHGRLAALEYTTDGGLTHLPIGGIVDVSFDQSMDTVETTDKDSGINKEFIAGHIGRTATASGNLESNDTGLSALYTGFATGATLAFRWRAQVGTGFNQDSFSGIITSWNASAPNTDKAQLSFDIQISGAIISAVQV